jgi:tRNA(fMet)-specific endonuclease VapC
VTALLLDTTFLIDVERGDADLDALVGDDDDLAMAAITVAELRVGVDMATASRREQRHEFVEAVVGAMPVLAYELRTAAAHTELLAASRRAGRSRGVHDLIIAATARVSGRTVVTADPRGFEGLPGVEVLRHR